jgi:hypothetical protein
MKLAEFQRTFFDLIRQPLTAAGGQRSHTRDGKPVRALADMLVTPGPRLAPFQRLELYSQGYWIRILRVLREDFAGLRALLGRAAFERLATAYLTDCPPDTFDLRRLGDRLEAWLARHLSHAPGRERAALDMVRLESAEIAARDAGEWPSLAELTGLGDDPCFQLQPHLRLLRLAYPVDRLLTDLRRRNDGSAAVQPMPRHHARRPPLPQPETVCLAVHRRDGMIYFKRLEPAAFVVLRGLQQGRPLSDALQTAVDHSREDVRQIAPRLQQWFAEWAALGWFCQPATEPARVAA